MDALIVKTGSGQLLATDVSAETWGAFGIPYAAAPVGDLRWQPTRKAASWQGLRDASRFGADPIQPAGPRVSRAPRMSEDCLYLNVWFPKAHRAGGWPVLVWSGGGAFTTGSGSFVDEDPVKLAARGAVVVSFNTRLNVFGFLAHEELSRASPHGTSGNYGLYDQVAALEWVREHIEAFNGDCARITFFGQSAGATGALLLLTSPLKQSLFDRAIFQSPGAFSSLVSRDAAERHGAAMGGSIDDLRNASSEDVLRRARTLPALRNILWHARPMRPIADGRLIVEQMPFEVGEFRTVPAIIGTNLDEGRFFESRAGVHSMAEFEDFLRQTYGDNAGEAFSRYSVADPQDVAAMFSAVYGDRGFTMPVDGLVRAFARRGKPVYRYLYAYHHATTGLAPTHGDEAGVLFDNLPHATADDARMADKLSRYWLNFAETGDPNGAELSSWPRFDEKSDKVQRLDIPGATETAWRRTFIDFVLGAVAGEPVTSHSIVKEN